MWKKGFSTCLVGYEKEAPKAQTTLQMRSSDVFPTDTHYMIGNEEEPGGSLLSLRPELLSNFLLPCVFGVERWIPEFEQSREPHGVGALLVSLSTIQTTITREEIRERTLHWVDGITLLSSL